jgi:hypothetical protein
MKSGDRRKGRALVGTLRAGGRFLFIVAADGVSYAVFLTSCRWFPGYLLSGLDIGKHRFGNTRRYQRADMAAQDPSAYLILLICWIVFIIARMPCLERKLRLLSRPFSSLPSRGTIQTIPCSRTQATTFEAYSCRTMIVLMLLVQ